MRFARSGRRLDRRRHRSLEQPGNDDQVERLDGAVLTDVAGALRVARDQLEDSRLAGEGLTPGPRGLGLLRDLLVLMLAERDRADTLLRVGALIRFRQGVHAYPLLLDQGSKLLPERGPHGRVDRF